MLGPQIPVTLYDLSGAVALDQRFRSCAQEVDQTSGDALDQGLVAGERRARQFSPGQSDLLLEPDAALLGSEPARA